MDEKTHVDQAEPMPRAQKPLSAAAKRALNEAAARRAAMATTQTLPPERNGRDGPEPVRYGDWEVKGLASDF